MVSCAKDWENCFEGPKGMFTIVHDLFWPVGDNCKTLPSCLFFQQKKCLNDTKTIAKCASERGLAFIGFCQLIISGLWCDLVIFPSPIFGGHRCDSREENTKTG